MKFKTKIEDSRNYLRLKDGESVFGVFRGDLFEYKLHWAENRSVVCSESSQCELCQTGNKAKFRFRVNFLEKEGNTFIAKIFEQGWAVYDALRTMNETDYDLEKYAMKISRKGFGLNTAYSILPVPNGMVREETEKKLMAIQLNDLGHIGETEKEAPKIKPLEPMVTDTYEDIPF